MARSICILGYECVNPAGVKVLSEIKCQQHGPTTGPRRRRRRSGGGGGVASAHQWRAGRASGPATSCPDQPSSTLATRLADNRLSARSTNIIKVGLGCLSGRDADSITGAMFPFRHLDQAGGPFSSCRMFYSLA